MIVINIFKRRTKSNKDSILLEDIKLLTKKESEVYEKLMDGYKLKEIAMMLDVKFTTINEHTKSIYKKLNVHSQKELIVKYRSVFKSEEV